MITTIMRRKRRSFAAILAAMLMASVLAVVAGSPAQAANTSYEVKIDTNADGVPDARSAVDRAGAAAPGRIGKHLGMLDRQRTARQATGDGRHLRHLPADGRLAGGGPSAHPSLVAQRSTARTLPVGL